MEHLSKLDFLLHEQLRKDAILNSLPKSYLPFLTHYRMTKLEVNYHGLLGLLQNFEKDHQLHKESVNLVGGSSSDSRPFKKGKKNKKKKVKKVQVQAGTSVQGQTRKIKLYKSQAECFFCKKQGHWKRNYPLYIASMDPNKPKKKQGNYMITLCNFFICDTTAWVLDTGSPYHICNSMQGLQVSRRFDDGERFLNIEDGSKVSVLALGIMNLVINSRM